MVKPVNFKIVCPYHIPEFIPIIKEWHKTDVIFEKGEAPSGRNVRQKYTDEFAGQDVWVHFLDCDNLIPKLVVECFECYTHKPSIIMFGQVWWAHGPKRLNAKPENCVPTKCDIAQLFVHGSFLTDMTWSSDYENDGQFIEELYKRYPNDFVFLNGTNVWYNSLKPNTSLYNGQIIEIA